MKIEVIDGTIKHVLDIIDILRPMEREAFKNKDAVKMIKQAFRESRAVYAGTIDGDVVGIWGIKAGTLLSNSGMLWLLTTKRVNEHPFVFVRHSQIEIKKLENEFSTIWGYVWSDYDLSVKWLRWLGFKMYPSEKPGVYYFEKKRA